MELVTGFKGEAHISAENWADLNRGLAGDGSYVLPVGEKFRAELVTNNLLKIYDGCGIFQGRQVVIPAGQSDEITIENGSQGEKRIDIVGVRYVKDESSKIETTESVYVKGTPAESDPVAPTLEEGNIRAGDLAATWALYQLELDGLNVVSVTPLFETLRSGAEVAEELEELNSNISDRFGSAKLLCKNLTADTNDHWTFSYLHCVALFLVRNKDARIVLVDTWGGMNAIANNGLSGVKVTVTGDPNKTVTIKNDWNAAITVLAFVY